MYKVRGIDGKEYGPVSVEMLRQWLAERRLTLESQVQAAGSTEWRPISAYPELTAPLSSAPSTPPLVASIPSSGGVRPSSGAATSGPAKTSGLALSSLILGLCGLISCGMTALVGLVLGIVAIVQIRKSQGTLKGEGLAITGICISGLFLLIGPAIDAGLLLPALAKAKERAQRIQCLNNMKQTGLALRMWANDHGGKFPSDLMSLSNQVPSVKILICPGEKLRDRSQATTWSDLSLIGSSYDYYGAGKDESRPQEVILECPNHSNVGLADGSVQQVSKGRVPQR